MMDETGKNGFEMESSDRLLKEFGQLADRIDQQRFPGRAWTAPTGRSPHPRRLPWRVIAAALAASILLGVMLYPGLASLRKRQSPPQFVSRSTAPASTQATPPQQQPTFLDAAVLAHVRLSAPDINLAANPVTLPSVGSRLSGPDSYTWDIPEIHLSSL